MKFESLGFSHSLMRNFLFSIWIFFSVYNGTALNEQSNIEQNLIQILLNSTDFNNNSTLEFVDLLISNFQSNDSTQNVDLFSESGVVALIKNEMDNLCNSNVLHMRTDTIKFYYGKIANILAIGSEFPMFCEKLVITNTFDTIFSCFTMDSVLFDDLNFTEDLFSVATVSVLNCVQVNSLRAIIQATLKYSFGSGLSWIENRFKAENSSTLKILLASLLTQQQNLTEFDVNHLTLDFKPLMDVRDILIDKMNLLVYRNIFKFSYAMRTSFILPLNISSVALARYSNSFLLTELNRQSLCDGSTLEFYLSPNELFSKSLELSICSMRAIHFLCLTCGDFPSILESRGIDDRKYDQNKIDEATIRHIKKWVKV